MFSSSILYKCYLQCLHAVDNTCNLFVKDLQGSKSLTLLTNSFAVYQVVRETILSGWHLDAAVNLTLRLWKTWLINQCIRTRPNQSEISYHMLHSSYRQHIPLKLIICWILVCLEKSHEVLMIFCHLYGGILFCTKIKWS